MNVTKLLGLFSIFLLLPACASTGSVTHESKLPEHKPLAGYVSLLDFIATGKLGEKQSVYDLEKNNEEGSAVIKRHYLAASGVQCRAYFWLPAEAQAKAATHNLNVACQAATGKWYKVRTLSNIEAFMEKEPVGYVLH